MILRIASLSVLAIVLAYQAAPENESDSPLEIRVAVPLVMRHGGRNPYGRFGKSPSGPVRELRYTEENSDAPLHIVLTNTSDTVVNILGETDEDLHNYAALRFELISNDGSIIRPLRSGGYGRTGGEGPHIILEPGESRVFSFPFNRKARPDVDWNKLKPANDGTVGLRAIYESAPSKSAAKWHIWTGKLVSEEIRVSILGTAGLQD